MAGMLIVIEGVDQSGKETQAQRLRERLREAGHKVRLLSFPDYGTSIGEEIARALQGEREYGADVMQLLFVANRHERREAIREWVDGGLILVCDRYRASSIAYGEAQGLDAGWLEDIQRYLPRADLTIFIDIAPATAADAEVSGAGSVRARSLSTRASAIQLPAAGDEPGLGSRRRGADDRRDRRGRVRGRAGTPASRDLGTRD